VSKKPSDALPLIARADRHPLGHPLRRPENGAGYRRMRERAGEDYDRLREDTLRQQREALAQARRERGGDE